MIPVPPPAPATVPLKPAAHAPRAPRGAQGPQGVRLAPERGTPNHAYDPSLRDKPYDYTTPIILQAVAADLTLAEAETQYVRTPQEIAALLQSWLRRPVFDPEYAEGVDPWAGEIAGWHDAQLARKAKILGCSLRMIMILEELVRCFIDERRPQGLLACRLLLEY